MRKLEDLLTDSVSPRMNGISKEGDALYISLIVIFEKAPTKHELILFKLTDGVACVSGMVPMDNMQTDTVSLNDMLTDTIKDMYTTVKYTNIEELALTDNFVLISLLRVYTQVLTKSGEDDHFVEVVIPALEAALMSAAELHIHTKQGIADIKKMSNKYGMEVEILKDTKDASAGFELMMHTLGIGTN